MVYIYNYDMDMWHNNYVVSNSIAIVYDNL
jgi:hypothetical protein